jgi:5-methylcytosine-specific restriction endonuclease McrA
MAKEKDIEAVWDRAATIRGEDPDTWRRDEHGNPIRWGSYGTHGVFGWEVDHRKPVAKGGSDHGRNLRALHTEANRKKSDKY